MRKIYKVVGGMLAAGVLLAGIGSGVAFAEYSRFEYGGEKVLEGSEYVTKTLTYQVTDTDQTDGKETEVNVYTDHYDHTIVEDLDVPENEVCFVIEYLSDRKDMKPEMIAQNVTKESQKKSVAISFMFDYYGMGEFHNFMRMKNDILDGLKESRLYDFQWDGIKKVEVHVNPDSDFVVNLNWGFYDPEE